MLSVLKFVDDLSPNWMLESENLQKQDLSWPHILLTGAIKQKNRLNCYISLEIVGYRWECAYSKVVL